MNKFGNTLQQNDSKIPWWGKQGLIWKFCDGENKVQNLWWRHKQKAIKDKTCKVKHEMTRWKKAMNDPQSQRQSNECQQMVFLTCEDKQSNGTKETEHIQNCFDLTLGKF